MAYDLMNKACTQVEAHFQLPLLWRNDAVVLPESLNMAKKRLSALKQRLKRDSSFKEMYCKEMQTLLDEGYGEAAGPKFSRLVYSSPRGCECQQTGKSSCGI